MFQFHRAAGRARALRRHLGRGLVINLGLFVVLSGSAAAFQYGGGGGTGKVALNFTSAAVGDPSVQACPGLGPEGQKIEARYEGRFTTAAEEGGIHFTLEILFDPRAGVGTAEGKWRSRG